MSFVKTCLKSLPLAAVLALSAGGVLAADIAVIAGSANDEFFNRIKKGVDQATQGPLTNARDILMNVGSLLGGGALLNDIDLGDLQLAVVGGGQLVQRWRDGLAGAAPFGPEIDQHGLVGLQDVGFKRAVAHMLDQFVGHDVKARLKAGVEKIKCRSL